MEDHYCECYCGGCACCEPEVEDTADRPPETVEEYLARMKGSLGAPGVGKTDLLKAIVHDLGLDWKVIKLSEAKPEDLSGLPVRG